MRPATSARPNDSPRPDERSAIDIYGRACNDLAFGRFYLQDNSLLRKSLEPEHVENRLIVHWGSGPGLAFAYVQMNRLIHKLGPNSIFRAGPGCGAPGGLCPVHLEGTCSGISPRMREYRSRHPLRDAAAHARPPQSPVLHPFPEPLPVDRPPLRRWQRRGSPPPPFHPRQPAAFPFEFRVIREERS